MKNKILHLDDFTESLASISKYKKETYEGKDNNYAKMMEALKNIIVGELTEKQKICTMLYYGEKMKMNDISKELGIGISSVSRHIKKAKIRIKKTMDYYFS